MDYTPRFYVPFRGLQSDYMLCTFCAVEATVFVFSQLITYSSSVPAQILKSSPPSPNEWDGTSSYFKIKICKLLIAYSGCSFSFFFSLPNPM